MYVGGRHEYVENLVEDEGALVYDEYARHGESSEVVALLRRLEKDGRAVCELNLQQGIVFPPKGRSGLDGLDDFLVDAACLVECRLDEDGECVAVVERTMQENVLRHCGLADLTL